MTSLPESADTVEAYKAARRDEVIAWMRWMRAKKAAKETIPFI